MEEGLRWGWVATIATSVLWDLENWQSILLRQLQSAREAGLLAHLLRYVSQLADIRDLARRFCGSCVAGRGG